MANMMDLFMGEIDQLKRDLYIDFGETQKIIAGDINQMRADLNQVELKVQIVEKSKIKVTESRAVESRLEAIEKSLADGIRVREVVEKPKQG